MIKSLEAVKCKDGWLVDITTKVVVDTKSDVLTIIRQEGLNLDKVVSKKDKIFAY